MPLSTSASNHPIFARLYPALGRTADSRGGAEYRRRLLEGLRGEVIEVGAGNGLNFCHYPREVSAVLAVEPEAHLRAMACEAALGASVPVKVVEGLADELPADDGAFDAAVLSLVLCSVPDQQAALGEVRRVLRPGGELRFYEHVVSHKPGVARVQRLADATFWPRLAAGCHAARDTGSAIEEAGFTIERVARFHFKPARLAPPAPHLLGIARRP
jgi:ubiquinone/menaquinone biosynthesis C-methylase UbiE